MSERDDFMELYDDCVKVKGESCYAAYDLAERRWKRRKGGRKYGSYNSFRVGRSRHMKKKRRR